MLHPLQVVRFRFEKLNIDTNREYNASSDKVITNDIKINFNVQKHKEKKEYRRIEISLLLNKSDKSFKDAPYRIDLVAGLELAFQDDIPEDEYMKHLQRSGPRLVITTLRAYLAQITSSFIWGEFILPTFNVDDLIKELFQSEKEEKSQ